jgi:hypothetical protein
LRRLRIAAPQQLPLLLPGVNAPGQRWLLLPAEAQATVLSLLARMIARGVVAEEVSSDDDD